MRVPVEIELGDELLRDLMVLAVEHFGYGSFDLVEYVGDPIEGCKLRRHEYYPLTEGHALAFVDRYGDSDERHTLDRDAVERGLRLMADRHTKNFMDLVTENSDVITGDVFLQLALLGEVVYG